MPAGNNSGQKRRRRRGRSIAAGSMGEQTLDLDPIFACNEGGVLSGRHNPVLGRTNLMGTAFDLQGFIVYHQAISAAIKGGFSPYLCA